MIIEKLYKHSLFTVYRLLFTILFFPAYAGAGWPRPFGREAEVDGFTLISISASYGLKGRGWLLWEAPAYIAAPAGEKELRSADMALGSVPVKAFLEGKPGAGLELDAVFEAGADDLRVFFGEAGFEETPYEFKKSFFGALTQLFSANTPSKFPPAPKWLAGGRPQDLSFIRLQKGGRQGAYLWRLPFRTKKAPLWAAGLRSPGGERGWPRSFGREAGADDSTLMPIGDSSTPKGRGWALRPEKAKKSRAPEIRVRRTGKTYFIFTLP